MDLESSQYFQGQARLQQDPLTFSDVPPGRYDLVVSLYSHAEEPAREIEARRYPVEVAGEPLQVRVGLAPPATVSVKK